MYICIYIFLLYKRFSVYLSSPVHVYI
uniref:Uncharacterized protein n=1 Tax=Arundo donax TaxID=35708 RepID=A0A0A9B1F3_ARUDO